MASRLVFAALRGGSGKTTLCLGLIQALKERGRDVVPFKKGPDFIDAGWLGCAAGRPCLNLDPFLMGREATLLSMSRCGPGQVALIEGNRGLFDGMDDEGTFSTAELAKLIRTPVVLIVDCTMVTRTVAAMILGCLQFDPQVRIGGVILNRIRGKRHGSLVRRTVERYTGVPVLGIVERVAEGLLPERHMGLVPPQEHPQRESALSAARNLVMDFVDVDRVLSLAESASPFSVLRVDPPARRDNRWEAPKIGVVRDSAFWFYYPENLEALEGCGARLVEVSSLKRGPVPDMDALYIGGGFPETHARAIAANEEFREWLRQAVECGLPVYAECGGLMLMGREVVTSEGRFPMAGVFPVVFRMTDRPQAHGYSILKADRENPFYPLGTRIHGHEFHYSKAEPQIGRLDTVFAVERGAGSFERRDGFAYKNALGLFTHVHAAGVPLWAENMVRKAAEFVREKPRTHAPRCEASAGTHAGSV